MEQQKETGSTPAVLRRDLSQLVTVRRAHQTNRAARSTKTRSNPHNPVQKNTNQSDHQQLHLQMVEVVNRIGTGLERNARWRSGAAPGTRSQEETLTLTGNSANAEFVAKERVNKVCGSHLRGKGSTISLNLQAQAMRAEYFNRGGINLSRFIAGGLVGDGRTSATPPRVPLVPESWVFVYSEGGVYVGKGMFPVHSPIKWRGYN